MKIVCIILLLAQYALAWGPTGHRVVGEIAQRHLSTEAKMRIKKWLGPSDHSLAMASTWADEIRNIPEYNPLAPLHFVNILPPSTTYAEYAETKQDDQGFNSNVVQALLQLKNFLEHKDPKVNLTLPALQNIDEAMALKLFIHFVGDIHQPLHVIDSLGPDGKSNHGGNLFPVQWLYKYQTDLHTVWDNEIIDQEKLSFEDMADFFDNATPSEQSKWGLAPITTWADESLSYRTQIYTFPDADKQKPGLAPVIWYGYISVNRETVKLRLEQGGIRLAQILNQIYGN